MHKYILTYCSEMSAEKRVIQMLMEKYSRVGKMGRPVRNTSHPVLVHFGLGLIQLDLNEKDKVLTMSMWTRYVSVTYI